MPMTTPEAAASLSEVAPVAHGGNGGNGHAVPPTPT